MTAQRCPDLATNLRRAWVAWGAYGRPGRGFSLVEFIVSVGILGLVVGLILQLAPFAHVANRRAWNANTAEDVCRTQMENTRSLALANFDALPAALGPTTEAHQGTDYRWTVNTAQYNGSSTLKVVTVEVQWTENGGPQHLISQSLVAREQVGTGGP